MNTYFAVRSDTRQIFDALSDMPDEDYLIRYSRHYNCEITVIRGQTVAAARHDYISDRTMKSLDELPNNNKSTIEAVREIIEYVDRAEFGRIEKIGNTLKRIFERDHIGGMEGKEDYLVIAVEEAKKETCPEDEHGVHDWQPFGVAGWLVCSKCQRKKPLK